MRPALAVPIIKPALNFATLSWSVASKSFFKDYWQNIAGGFTAPREIVKWDPGHDTPPRNVIGFIREPSRINWTDLAPLSNHLPLGPDNVCLNSDTTCLGERAINGDITPDGAVILPSPDVAMTDLLMCLGTRTALDQYQYDRDKPELKPLVPFDCDSHVLRPGALGENSLESAVSVATSDEVVVPAQLKFMSYGDVQIPFMTPAVYEPASGAISDPYTIPLGFHEPLKSP